MDVLEPWQWAILIKPFMLFVVTVLILYPARMAMTRYFPEGKLKRLLLRRIS